MALYIIYRLLALANLLYLTRFWGGAISSHLSSLGSIQGCCLTWCTHLVKPLAIITCLSLVLEELEALWLSMNPMVFNVHQSHRHDSTYPSLFYWVGYHLYICGVQHTWAYSHITLWSNAGRMVTHPCINWAHDCLTSVIKHKMFAPCYVSQHTDVHVKKWARYTCMHIFWRKNNFHKANKKCVIIESIVKFIKISKGRSYMICTLKL